MIRHSKRICNGYVKIEISNSFKIWGNPIFTQEGTKISSIKIEDLFKLKKNIQYTDLKLFCKNCQEYVSIEDIEVECTHCYEWFKACDIWVLSGTGGYYCDEGKDAFKEDVSIEFMKLIDCVKLIR